jgi:CubicO group peptidase (beta-lactamase class C family)
MHEMRRIASLVDAALAEQLGSAAAVSVGDSGVEVFRYVAGRTRRVPDAGPAIDERAVFDLASLTKPIATASLAMALVAERALDLDAPVRAWIADAATTGTVAQLLSHTAGCIAHVEFFRELREHPPSDPRAALVAMAARTPANPPGVERVYSDLGYILLGEILARASGTDLATATAARDGFGRWGSRALDVTVATELDYRGLVCGDVHDDNAYWGGRVCGHAGLFGTIDDVSRFAATLLARAGEPIFERFVTARPPLGWDTPSREPGVSHAGDRWPREHAIGHLGFTGTSLWLDLARRRWVALLTNRVHPTRGGDSADRVKALRRAVADAALDALDA